VAAGFALANPLGAVLRAGTGFKIVQSHKILIRPPRLRELSARQLF
jgi:hypothetical protein